MSGSRSVGGRPGDGTSAERSSAGSSSALHAPETRWTVLDSGVGPLTLVATDAGLRNVWFADETLPAMDDRTRLESAVPGPVGGVSPRLAPGTYPPVVWHLAAACRQLRAYFAGERSPFDLTIDPQGTPFQQRVWRALIAIPLGATRTYGAIAAEITAERPDQPTSARAVAAAVGRTPIPIVIPCHRVIGGDGSLTGYRGGLDRKRALLELEGAAITSPRPSEADARTAVSAGQLPLL